MIRRSSIALGGWILAVLFAALCVTGCSRTLGRGLDLQGMRRAKLAAPRAPTVTTSVYARSPTLEWSAHVVGPPSSPGPNLFARTSDDACPPTAQGLSRVLPIAQGLPARSVMRYGTVGVAVAGLPAGVGPSGIPSESVLAEAMMEHTSIQGTSGHACRPSVFAYVSLGIGRDFEPVSVLR
ncbi:MAG TPA: hypothetical protein VJ997_13355 [Longimicrobiales bacterium]|nr:hypothetical protein [Longimicrobiales bacterium]